MGLCMKMVLVLSTFGFLLGSMSGCACMFYFIVDVDEGMLVCTVL